MIGSRLEVPAWVVLYAIRYGLPRSTYAHHDALDLITAHAETLVAEGWNESVRDDLATHCAACDADVSHYHAREALHRAEEDV